MNDTLRAVITEAIETLTLQTALSVDELLGERVLEPSQMSAVAAHAAGVIEGAGIALGMTALELLDALEGESS